MLRFKVGQDGQKESQNQYQVMRDAHEREILNTKDKHSQHSDHCCFDFFLGCDKNFYKNVELLLSFMQGDDY